MPLVGVHDDAVPHSQVAVPHPLPHRVYGTRHLIAGEQGSVPDAVVQGGAQGQGLDAVDGGGARRRAEAVAHSGVSHLHPCTHVGHLWHGLLEVEDALLELVSGALYGDLLDETRHLAVTLDTPHAMRRPLAPG